jgi:hypothetical protein
MAAITELSLTAINDEAPSPVFTFDSGTNDVKLSLKTLLGVSSLSGLTEEVFVKAIWQLIDLGQKAQDTANDGAATGENLSAFSLTSSTPFDPLTKSQNFGVSILVTSTTSPLSINGQHGG